MSFIHGLRVRNKLQALAMGREGRKGELMYFCDSLQSSKVNKIISSGDENRQSNHKTFATGETPSLFFLAGVSLSSWPADIMHRCRTAHELISMD